MKLSSIKKVKTTPSRCLVFLAVGSLLSLSYSQSTSSVEEKAATRTALMEARECEKHLGPFPKLRYEAKTLTLTIDGGGESFSLPKRHGQYPLRCLPIKRLILIDTVISDSSEIAALKMLQVADLRGSQISSIGEFNMLPNLRMLLVRADQLSQE